MLLKQIVKSVMILVVTFCAVLTIGAGVMKVADPSVNIGKVAKQAYTSFKREYSTPRLPVDIVRFKGMSRGDLARDSDEVVKKSTDEQYAEYYKLAVKYVQYKHQTDVNW